MIKLLGTAFAVALVALLGSAPPALAQFTQQGAKLVGTGAVGNALQGTALAISADGNTAIVGGRSDNSSTGAAWIYTRTNGVWSQQGNKLVGTGGVGNSQNQGYSISLSADGNTAAIGGYSDNSGVGAVWIFVRNAGVWSQQGAKLLPTGAVGASSFGTGLSLSGDGNTLGIGAPQDSSNLGATYIFTRSGTTWSQLGSKLVGTGSTGATVFQGFSVAMSDDGNTAIVGGLADSSDAGATWVFVKSNGAWSQQGPKLKGNDAVGTSSEQGYSVSLSADGNTAAWGGYTDNGGAGASWVFTRMGGVWSQQGGKLVGTGAVGNAYQGYSVRLSGDGNNLIAGGYADNGSVGAAWAFGRTGTVWSQQGSKLVGTGATGLATQGYSVALSKDGGTAVVAGDSDNSNKGAVWFFTRPALSVSPTSAIAASGNVGGPFSPPSFDYTLNAINNDINYTVSGVPPWLTPSSTFGTVTAGTSKTINFTVNGTANGMAVGTSSSPISIANTTNGFGSVTLNATLTVGTPGPVSVVSAVLPASRSVQVGTAATAFSTIINTSSSVATNCGLGLGSPNPVSFRYQTTDSASNALSGTPNTPINIPPNGVQSFVFAVTPSGAFDPTDVPITAGCSNSAAAPNVVGLNTLLLSASNAPVPDIVALGATASNDGIINIPGATGTGAFAVATVNVGIAGAITVSADTGATSLPLSINVCQTDPVSGQCTSVLAPTTTTPILANGTPTFAIFVQGSANVPFDPAKSRVFARFKDAGGIVRGATSVAVRTQ